MTDARPEWRAQTELMDHQREAIAKLLPSRVGALFMEMGTGKTRTMIEMVRLRQRKISRVVWFCPVTLKATIRREILKHTDCNESDVYVFDGRTRENTLPMDRLWYIVGIESMSASPRAIYCARALIDDRACVVVDESTYIKGHAAKRTRRITGLAEVARYRTILTGTPITQGVVDLFAQMRFLSHKILGYRSFYTFARNHLVYHPKNKGQIIGSRNVAWLTARMKPYVYQVTKDECLSLPPKLYEDDYCDFTTEQAAAYQQAKAEFADDLLRYDDPGSDMSNGIAIFRLFSRLQAIACGIFDGEPIPHNRLELLTSAMTDVQDSHAVVWVKYLRNMDEIEAAMIDEGRTVFRIDGNVPDRRRNERLDQWRRQGGTLVASQAVGGHGLDMTAAATAVFFSSGFKFSERLQAEDRHHRIGTTRPVTYVRLWAECGIEARIASALDNKEDVLQGFRAEIEQVKRTGKDRLREFVMSL